MQSTKERRWWDIGETPAFVFDPENPVTFESSDGWAFSSSSTIPPVIQSVCGFPFPLTNDQLIVVAHMMDKDMVIPGHYEDWEYFCLVHNLNTSV